MAKKVVIVGGVAGVPVLQPDSGGWMRMPKSLCLNAVSIYLLPTVVFLIT